MCCYLCSAFLRMARGAGGFLFSLDFLLIPTVGFGVLHVCIHEQDAIRVCTYSRNYSAR
jgi:hypothetical protein